MIAKAAKTRRKVWIILSILVFVVLLLFGSNFIFNRYVKLTRYDVYNDKLPASFYGYEILVISDFQNAYFYNQIAAIAAREMPDIIVLTGDMVSLDEGETDNLELLLKSFSKDTPVYAVSGNHESMSAENDANVRRVLEAWGVQYLDNSVALISAKNGDTIRLLGVADPGLNDDQLVGSAELEQTRAFIQEFSADTVYSILLCHRANLYASLYDLSPDLMLAGHLRGGLIRLPFIGGLVSDEGFLPRYNAGLYKDTEMTLIVSRGCDYNLSKMRVFNQPEILLVTLRR